MSTSIAAGLFCDPMIRSESLNYAQHRLDAVPERMVDMVGGGVLPDWMIAKYVKITPFEHSLVEDNVISYGVSSGGYDFRLGTKFRRFKTRGEARVHENRYGKRVVIDPKNFDAEAVTVPFEEEKPFELAAHSFLLAESVEHIVMPDDVIGICLGKSTYCRTGMVLNATPLEAGWKGRITIEIVNTTDLPMMLYPNEGVMQVVFVRKLMLPDRTYADRKGKYQDQAGLQTPFIRRNGHSH